MKVAAIIPAFNEEKTIAPIVRAAKSHPLISETIVVDDGSFDATFEIAQEAGARVIKSVENQGKGRALEKGVQGTDAELLLFLDADLIGLEKKHLDWLLQSVIRGQADMTIGAIDRSVLGPFLGRWLRRTESPFAGTRALKRSFWEAIPDRYKKEFYIESVITYLAKKNKLKTKPFILKGVKHVVKEKKLGIWKGTKERWRMNAQIVFINFALRVKPRASIKIKV